MNKNEIVMMHVADGNGTIYHYELESVSCRNGVMTLVVRGKQQIERGAVYCSIDGKIWDGRAQLTGILACADDTYLIDICQRESVGEYRYRVGADLPGIKVT